MVCAILKAGVELNTLGEKIVYGAKISILGMITVFTVLTILLLVLQLFKLFAYTLPMKKKASVKVEQAPVEKAPVEEYGEEDVDDAELIAVITAAIEAYKGDGACALPFRVVSYKRVRRATGWNGENNNEAI